MSGRKPSASYWLELLSGSFKLIYKDKPISGRVFGAAKEPPENHEAAK